MMTPRQRHVATIRFAHPDRVPFDPGYGRKSTLAAWHRQGLPENVSDYVAHLRDLLGIPHPPADPWCDTGLDFRMIPQFEEKVLERKPAPPASKGPGSLIVQDWKGNICEISDEFDVSYLRNPTDFVTRSWLKCPVENHADWRAMRQRYDPQDPRRFPTDWPHRRERLARRTFVSMLPVPGPFWQLREWLGFENLCMAFLDDPAFVEEMIEFWTEFVAAMFTRIFQEYVPDFIVVQEDMAYKEKPMVGPDMARKFLLPCWRRWIALATKAGVPVVEMDSDGHMGQILPVFIDAGFQCNSPLEVAAGNDLPAYRKLYGTQIGYRGGVDKRAMAAGGAAIRKEMARLQPVIEAGGYIPQCDHGIPADVSWPNFVEYCRLLAKATGWI